MQKKLISNASCLFLMEIMYRAMNYILPKHSVLLEFYTYEMVHCVVIIKVIIMFICQLSRMDKKDGLKILDP